MDIDKLTSVKLLRKAGKDLPDFSDFVQLQRNSNDASLSDQDFALGMGRVGPAVARELWKFLNGLPDKVEASGHFHFATGMKEPSMAPPGSTALAAVMTWSKILSEAIDLASYDFAAIPTGEARATFDRMGKLLSDENDGLVTARLRFFQVRNTGK